MLFRNINKGDILSNRDICNEAMCANMGGIRYSKATKSLILFIKGDDIYKDEMDANGVWNYVGMGQKGDQDFEWRQNRRLRDFLMNKKILTLLKYTYLRRKKQITFILAK